MLQAPVSKLGARGSVVNRWENLEKSWLVSEAAGLPGPVTCNTVTVAALHILN